MDKSRLKSIRLFLFDMDGTLYLGDRLFPFTAQLLNTIKKAGKKYLFITNNSSKSVNDYVEKLKRLGLTAAPSDFLTSSQATAFFLKNNNFTDKLIYVCGTASLKKELEDSGFTLTTDREKAECVVVGFDTELTFKKLEDVSFMLCTKDIPFIATNPDYVCPTEFGSVPDCGSICDMLYNATGKRPTVIGKPSPLMIELAMKKECAAKETTAVVGDRIYTDVKSGNNAGVLSVLVMSGETDGDILSRSSEKPDIVLENAGEITRFL